MTLSSITYTSIQDSRSGFCNLESVSDIDPIMEI